MSKWIVCYSDKYGDTSRVWTEANDENEAIDNIYEEYWDINEIIYCHEM